MEGELEVDPPCCYVCCLMSVLSMSTLSSQVASPLVYSSYLETNCHPGVFSAKDGANLTVNPNLVEKSHLYCYSICSVVSFVGSQWCLFSHQKTTDRSDS